MSHRNGNVRDLALCRIFLIYLVYCMIMCVDIVVNHEWREHDKVFGTSSHTLALSQTLLHYILKHILQFLDCI